LNPEQIEEKLTRRPQSPLFAYLAAKHLERDEPERARELCLTGIDLYPAYSSAYYILAKIFARESNFTSAHESIQRAISLNPTASTFLQFRTEIELRLSPTIEVLPEIEQIPEVDSALGTEMPQHSVEELETADGETIPEKIVESPVDVIPDICEPEISDNVEEQRTSDNEPEIRIAISQEPATIPIENVQEEPARLQSGIDNETPTIETSGENETLLDSVLPDDVVTEELSNDQNTIVSEENTSSGIVDPPIDDSAVLWLPQVETEITSETVKPEAVTGEEIVSDSPAATEEPKQNDDQKYKPTVTQQNDDGRIVSRTLAEIFASQGEYQEAITTYTLLKQVRPHLSDEIDARIGELENLQRERTG
jgi:tetratricopeptide (TPR) repeat protein